MEKCKFNDLLSSLKILMAKLAGFILKCWPHVLKFAFVAKLKDLEV